MYISWLELTKRIPFHSELWTGQIWGTCAMYCKSTSRGVTSHTLEEIKHIKLTVCCVEPTGLIQTFTCIWTCNKCLRDHAKNIKSLLWHSKLFLHGQQITFTKFSCKLRVPSRLAAFVRFFLLRDVYTQLHQLLPRKWTGQYVVLQWL